MDSVKYYDEVDISCIDDNTCTSTLNYDVSIDDEERIDDDEETNVTVDENSEC